MKRVKIATNFVVKIQNLVVNHESRKKNLVVDHESRPVKSNLVNVWQTRFGNIGNTKKYVLSLLSLID